MLQRPTPSRNLLVCCMVQGRHGAEEARGRVRWTPSLLQSPHVGLAHLLDAASVGALERPGGNNVTALNLQSRPDVNDELILAATNCFPCLRWSLLALGRLAVSRCAVRRIAT